MNALSGVWQLNGKLNHVTRLRANMKAHIIHVNFDRSTCESTQSIQTIMPKALNHESANSMKSTLCLTFIATLILLHCTLHFRLFYSLKNNMSLFRFYKICRKNKQIARCYPPFYKHDYENKKNISGNICIYLETEVCTFPILKLFSRFILVSSSELKW